MNPIFIQNVHYTIMLQHVNAVNAVYMQVEARL